MRNLHVLLLLACLVWGCGSSKPKWEYKTLVVSSKAEAAPSDTEPRTIALKDEQLNSLGEEGWELVGCWAETESVFPNFGREDYHTGIKNNTRTSKVALVFKRAKSE